MDFETYISEVKKELRCNAPESDRLIYHYFDFTNEQIDQNLQYFENYFYWKLPVFNALNNFLKNTPHEKVINSSDTVACNRTMPGFNRVRFRNNNKRDEVVSGWNIGSGYNDQRGCI